MGGCEQTVLRTAPQTEGNTEYTKVISAFQ